MGSIVLECGGCSGKPQYALQAPVNLFIFPLGFVNKSSFKSVLLMQYHASLV